MEAVLEDAIAGGARALLIFDSCYLETDTTPKLLDRLKENARACGIPICGGNAMGVLQLRAKDIRQPLSPLPPNRPGHIAFIAHSRIGV